MTLSLDNNQAKYQIRAYEPGIIKINDQLFTRSIIVTPDQLITDWPPQTLTELNYAHLKMIRELRPSILLLGTGNSLKFPAIEIYGDLINENIGVEVMDTHAACRTYNALTSENRHVIAALIIK